MTTSTRKTAANTASKASVSGWIVRKVSFATYKREDEIDGRRLAESLALLEKGVDYWNNWRSDHPEFRPYLANANLSWTNKHLELDDFEDIDFSNAELQETDFEGVSLARADLTGAKLKKANFLDAGLNEAILTEADLSFANLNDAHLQFANFDDATMMGANLDGAELSCASLQGANLRYASLNGIEADEIHAMGADFSYARLVDADLSAADLSGADLTYATIVRTNFNKAVLTGCNVYGVSVWDVELEGAEQSGLLIAREEDSPVRVDDIEVAQFVHLLLNHRKLRKTIDAVAQRGVLILGRFSNGGLEVLEALAATLREQKYLPIIFDFDRPSDRNYTETIMTLAGLSRFAVADLSGPSVPHELHATVPHFKIPFVPIIEAGQKPYAMFTDIQEYPWVLELVKFRGKNNLQELAQERIIAPAEERHRARQALLAKIFQSD